MDGEWEVLRVVTQRYEADLIAAVLEANGIPTYIKSEGANEWYRFTVGLIAEVRIMVPKGQTEAAEAALKASALGGESGEPSQP